MTEAELLALWDERLWHRLPAEQQARIKLATFDAYQLARSMFDR